MCLRIKGEKRRNEKQFSTAEKAPTMCGELALNPTPGLNGRSDIICKACSKAQSLQMLSRGFERDGQNQNEDEISVQESVDNWDPRVDCLPNVLNCDFCLVWRRFGELSDLVKDLVREPIKLLTR